MTARFSIITAVWNTEPRFLRELTESILAQRYPNWEWCIVDDGSTRPETRALLQRLGGRDPRIRVSYLHEHSGISAAQNRALELARGEFVALVDHDDRLEPAALRLVARVLQDHPDADVIYTDEDYIDTAGTPITSIRKPAWSPEYLLACAYMNHLTVYRRSVVTELGGFNPDYVLAQDWDLALRVTEVTDRIHHIPEILYHWRRNPTSAGHEIAAATYWRKRCHADHVRARFGPTAVSQPVWADGFFWTLRPIEGRPLVSIVIPTVGSRRWLRGRGVTMITNCIRSLITRTRYERFEVVVVVDPRTPPSVRRELAAFTSDRVRLVQASGPFNFSSRINLGVSHTRGEHLVLLNDDTEVVRPDWLEAMLELSQDQDIGVVGGKLVFPNGKVESCGVAIALPDADRLPYTPFWGYPGYHPGHVASLAVNRDFSAVTGACQMVRADVFAAVGGYDEAFEVDFGDVDFCLRVRELGYHVVTCPRALLKHYEAASRPTGGTNKRAYQARWSKAEERYWNPWAVIAQDYAITYPVPPVVAGPHTRAPAAVP